MIEIPKNTYQVPIECREEVVDALCQILLREVIFHPICESVYRKGAKGVFKDEKGTWRFSSMINPSEGCIRFRGCEVQKAFDLLIDAGYYIFRIFEYGTWGGYKLYKTPYIPNGSYLYDGAYRVNLFEEKIDF